MGAKHFSDEPVYTYRPYHAPMLSDDEAEDDDICVWKDGPILPGFDSEDEILVGYGQDPLVTTVMKNKENAKKARSDEKEAESSNINTKASSEAKGKEKIRSKESPLKASVESTIDEEFDRLKSIYKPGLKARLLGRVESWDAHSESSFSQRTCKMPESPKISSRTRSERESPENGESSKSNDISGSSTASKTRAPEKVENSESSSGMSSRRSRRKHDSQTRQAEPSHASISRSQTTVPDTSESALDSNNNLQQTRPKGSLKRHESKATQTDEPPSAMRSNTEPQIIIPDTPKHTDKHHPGFPKTRSKSSPRRHESQKRHAELSHTSSAKPQLRVVEIAKRANDPDTGLVKTRSQSRPKRHESQRRQPEPPRVEKSNLQIPVPETSQNSVDPVPASRAKGTLREREMQYAFSTTRRNLTHISQFMLKLEARTGKATKEGIRNTLDATVNDKNYNLSATPDYFAEIEELKHMSDNIYTRLFLIDRHWRRIARNRRKEEGKSPDIRILSEPDIKDWLRVELQTNHLVAEETSYFTVRDLANGRSFREWIQYLRVLCEFRDHPHDEAKLVDLAWLFLDRNLRGPRPSNPTTGEQLIAELEAKKRSGFWADALQNAMKQEEDDAEAWRTMRRYWSSRTAPA